jgi:16S rRNA processing protein RimM
LETDFPERLQPGARLYVGEDHRPVTISKRREHNDGLLLAFVELPGVEDVEAFRNVPLSAAVADRPPLPAGEYYQHQLLGLEVIEDSGEPLGTLVEILHTGGNEVFVVRPEEGGELLLPAIDQVVRAVDLKAKRMTVHLLPGLRSG